MRLGAVETVTLAPARATPKRRGGAVDASRELAVGPAASSTGRPSTRKRPGPSTASGARGLAARPRADGAVERRPEREAGQRIAAAEQAAAPPAPPTASAASAAAAGAVSAARFALDQAGVDPAGEEVGLAGSRARKPRLVVEPGDPRRVERPARRRSAAARVGAVHDQLGDHRVVVRADASPARTPVSARTPGREAEVGQRAGGGQEARGGILGVEAGLERVAA